VVRNLGGESLLAIRLLPALAGALTVYLTGAMTCRFGGGRLAQLLAMVAAILAPVYLALNHFYSMNAFDLLFWVLAAYLFVLILEQPQPRLWLWFGVVLGLGLLNKISVLWLGCGLAIGLVLSGHRRLLGTPWPWLSGGLALLLFLPHLIWQVRHAWPTLEFMQNAAGEKMAHIAPWEFLWGQILAMNPTTFLIWCVGLIALLTLVPTRRYQPLAWAYLAIFLLLSLSGSSRANYLAPAYTWLWAAGGLTWERWIRQARRAWLPTVAVVLVALPGLMPAPLGLPILPVQTYIRYAEMLGMGPSTDENKELAELPQFFADMHGWEEIVSTVAAVYDTLSPAERVQTRVFTPNYGLAGAIDLLGRRHGLPPALSGHNSYWYWGPPAESPEIFIVLGQDREGLAQVFEQVEQAATIQCGYCMPYENNRPVWLCRGLKTPLAELWPEVRHFQ
jgi:hypothetical protein